MIDSKALAYVNMYGVLGALENLCALDAEARAVLAGLKRPIALCFAVKDGPVRTFRFSADGCAITEGDAGCTAKMTFSSPEKFNALISDARPGLPVKGIPALLSFLTGPFTKLTDRLSAVLRPSEKDLADRAFFEENTLLTLYVIAGSVSALANHDPIARISADYTPDGDVLMGIKDGVHVTISVKDHVFTTVKAPCEHPRAVMEFADLDLANGLFNGKVSTINEMCRGRIRLAGMLSMVDNVNRILDRAAVYLA